MNRVLKIFFLLPLLLSPASAPASPTMEWLADHDLELHGFLDVRTGARLQDDPYEKDFSLAETRLQLDLDGDAARAIFKIKADLVGDAVAEDLSAELREANLLFLPLDFMDVKIGRQPLTWGTGDLLFINDLFPKDWESFFIGRDNEYLKAPSDALKASLFFEPANIDLVYVPIFNNSTYIDGSRLSYWNPLLARVAGRDFVFADQERNRFPEDSEFALRLYRNFRGIETAFYGYSGFWKTPEGLDPATMTLTYPRLAVWGVSARGPVWQGIANIEAGYYDSREDRDGDDPFVRNSEWRLLTGYEREVATDFTAAIQYYLELMQDYDAYHRTAGPFAKDEFRHVFTLRLTRLLLNQNLQLSLFSYYSPSDDDGHLRPNIHYKITDQWAVEGGGNIFFGSADHTFFGQFENNTNLYVGVRRTF
ncbi:MAG: hypothetical protein M8357_11060 [Desulfobulbaceae bacterium]|nr:hypothetical protein [Desulfobulbaceae bacterium]